MAKLNFYRIIKSKIFFGVAFVILIFIGISFTQEILRRMQINQEIATLQQQINDLEERNSELTDVIQYLNSTTWQEKEARTKLNLKKAGETVVVTQPVKGQTQMATATDIAVPAAKTTLNNPHKWLNYFVN